MSSEPRPLISAAEVQRRVAELGCEVTAAYPPGTPVLLVAVLKGAAMFLADLSRAINRPVEWDFMAVSSYGAGTTSSGVVRLLKDLDQPIEGRQVLLVEDIVDSGATLAYLVDLLRRRDPADVRICALLDKGKRRQRCPPVDFVGFQIPDQFVVGYGLDYAGRHRNLPYIGVLE